MQRVRYSQGKSFVVILLAASLFLALTLSEAHAHPADDTHYHAYDVVHEHGKQGGTPIADHTGCHATPFFAGVIFASTKLQLSLASQQRKTRLSMHNLHLSSAILGFDPPPPRFS